MVYLFKSKALCIMFVVVCNQQLRVNEFGIYELVDSPPFGQETCDKPKETPPVAVVESSDKTEPAPESVTTSTTSAAETTAEPSKPGLSLNY